MPTPVLLQSAFKTAGAVTSSTLAFPNPVSANSLLVAYILASTGSVAVLTASDSLNGPYNPDITLAANLVTGAILTFPGSLAGSATVTFSQTSGSAQLRLTLEEWGNVVTSSPVDGTPGSHGTGTTTTFQTGSTTTTLSNDLILTAMFQNGSTTPTSPPSGFTQDIPAGTTKIWVGWQTGGAVGTYAGSWTLPTLDSGVGLIAAYSAAGGPPQPGPLPRCVYVMP